MSNVKVLMFGWEFPPHNSGGLGVACEGLANALVDKGVDLTFVLPKKFENIESKIRLIFANEITKIKFKYIDSNINPYKTSLNTLTDKEKFISDSFYRDLVNEVLNYEKEAERIAQEEDFDIIHAHDWLSFGAGIKAKKVANKPLVAHIHATEFDRSGNNSVNAFIYQKEKQGFEHADKIIAVSGLTKNTVSERYGINENKIQVVHNGINYEDKTKKQQTKLLKTLKQRNRKLVLFLGRLTLQKNPEIMLHAAKIVNKYVKDSIFIYAGSGEMERELMEKTAEMKLSDKVLFAGFVRGKEKDALVRASDVFIMPSISEPFGLVALEAIHNGTPVIISKQSGVSEVLSHALKVDFWDTDELANKIIGVLSNKSLKETMSVNALQESKSLTWENAAEKVMEVYRSLLPSYTQNYE